MFEYLIRYDIEGFDFPENELNRLGKDGWELIAISPATSKNHFIFKRELKKDKGSHNSLLTKQSI